MPIIKETPEARSFVISITTSAKDKDGDFPKEQFQDWKNTIKTNNYFFSIDKEKELLLKEKVKELNQDTEIEFTEEFHSDFLKSEEFKAITVIKYQNEMFKGLPEELSEVMEKLTELLDANIMELTSVVDLNKLNDE